MKSLWVFYLLLFGPATIWIIHIFHPAFLGGISNTQFLIGFVFYLFVYRQLLCGLRLLATGKINRNQFILNFIPFWNDKYFGFLFFNRNS